jgi:ABC-type Fe3+-siderophore transport system permease subunit
MHTCIGFMQDGSSKSEEVCFRLLCPVALVGAIIGKVLFLLFCFIFSCIFENTLIEFKYLYLSSVVALPFVFVFFWFRKERM